VRLDVARRVFAHGFCGVAVSRGARELGIGAPKDCAGTPGRLVYPAAPAGEFRCRNRFLSLDIDCRWPRVTDPAASSARALFLEYSSPSRSIVTLR